jgi:hypothetical protein
MGSPNKDLDSQCQNVLVQKGISNSVRNPLLLLPCLILIHPEDSCRAESVAW